MTTKPTDEPNTESQTDESNTESQSLKPAKPIGKSTDFTTIEAFGLELKLANRIERPDPANFSGPYMEFPSGALPLHIPTKDDAYDGDSTGEQIWDEATAMLTSYLAENGDVLNCTSVLELGAGVGLVGIFAGLLVKCKEWNTAVVITDGDPYVVQRLEKTLELNKLDRDIVATALAWGERDLDHKFDLIIAADVVYVTLSVKKILRCVKQHLATGGMFLLAQKMRYTVRMKKDEDGKTEGIADVASKDEVMENFLIEAKEFGFKVEVLKSESHEKNERKLYKITIVEEPLPNALVGDQEAEAFMKFTEHLLSMKEDENATKVETE